MSVRWRAAALLIGATTVLGACSSPADAYLDGLAHVCQRTSDYATARREGGTANLDELEIAAVDALVGWTELELPAGLSPVTAGLDTAFRADDFASRLTADPESTHDDCVELEANAREDLAK